MFAYDQVQQVLVLFSLRGPQGVAGVHLSQLKAGWKGDHSDYCTLPRVGQAPPPPIQVAPDMAAARALAESLNGMRGQKKR